MNKITRTRVCANCTFCPQLHSSLRASQNCRAAKRTAYATDVACDFFEAAHIVPMRVTYIVEYDDLEEDVA